MSIFTTIRNLAKTTSNEYLERAQSRGNKIIGYTCTYVPEEMIHAAGAIPYRLRAVESEGTSLGDTYFSSGNCSFVRRVLDKGLRGDFGFLDGIIFMNGCDHNRRLYDNWSHAELAPDFIYMLFVPHARSDASFAQFTNSLKKFKAVLEEKLGTKITAAKLRKSVTLYNRKRSLLKEIAHTRKNNTVPISGTEFLALMLAVTAMPVEDSIDLLTSVLLEIKSGRVYSNNAQLRLFITGSCLEELSHLELLETGGAVVVADALCLGARYYEKNVKSKGSIFTNIGKRYLENLSCPRIMDDYHGRMEYTTSTVQKFKADAVVFEKIEFCSMMSGESYIGMHEMRKSDIPSITLTRELYGGGVGQLKTRIQAFYERVQNSL
jgi:benzoyl-CoA reductase/2-hydroxyglutaryl-CoA dehydratase subunit BcrC/BadD/HgdB